MNENAIHGAPKKVENGILLRKETNGYAFFLVGNWLVLTKIESLFVYKVWLRK